MSLIRVKISLAAYIVPEHISLIPKHGLLNIYNFGNHLKIVHILVIDPMVIRSFI